MAYTPTVWEDFPDTDTLVDAARLNHAEGGIKDAHDDLAAEVTRATNAEGVLSTAVAARLTQAQADLLYEPLGGGGAAGLGFMSTIGDNWAYAMTAGANVAWSFADRAVYIRVTPARDVLLTKLLWRYTSTSGNYDVGIYDADTNVRLWSKGSTATPGGAGVVTDAVSPALAMTGGHPYYVAIAFSATTALRQLNVTADSAALAQFQIDGVSGMAIQNSAFPLPDPAVPSATGALPIPFIVLRED